MKTTLEKLDEAIKELEAAQERPGVDSALYKVRSARQILSAHHAAFPARHKGKASPRTQTEGGASVE